MRPDVLVLDEPAAGLTRPERKRFSQTLPTITKKRKTVVIVSHSMDDMARYCDNVIVLSGGRAVLAGTRDEVFSKTRELIAAGLDVPHATKLRCSLRKKGIKLPDGIFTADDTVEKIAALFEN